ncbi:uncharacterized protein [Primulina eburnea]|uniref:uncharacterized protein n=1 Tax=Primulina eburnea TaxID=1245227 RepID=UPI003C6BDE42
MDNEWMHLPSKLVPEYEEGVKKFIAQARNYAKTREVILCPCKHCKNKKYLKFNQVYDHLIIKGFDPSYTIWVFHGETYNSQSEAEGSSVGVQKKDETREVGHTIAEAKDYELDDLLKDVETPLFPVCTSYTKLSAVVTLYNYKSTNGHTDNSFNELLKILGDVLPENNTLPQTVYMMRKLLKPFDLGYEKIHACPNDYPRNLRLGLATDGCNPFGDLSYRYSCWPLILVNYNLSPLLCITKENLMLTLRIPGLKQPGNDIDVYLEPFVVDLKELWETGVEAYDAFSKSMFNLKAILMWTINDFPAYGNLAGCATKWKLGCQIYNENICSMWFKYSRKFAYLGHRRFLAPNHPFRQKKKWFNREKKK